MRVTRSGRVALAAVRSYLTDKDVRSGIAFHAREGRWPGAAASWSRSVAPTAPASTGAPRVALPGSGDEVTPAVPVPRVRLGEIARGGSTFERTSLVDAPPHVNLVLPGLDVERIYAGLLTAMTVGWRLAEARGVPLRVVLTSEAVGSTSTRTLRRWLVDNGFDPARAATVDLVERAQVPSATFGVGDVWVATYWTTAHALDLACRRGAVDRDRVVYLVQDFEPSFSGWSDQYAIAESTYRAGFTPMVNSRSLADYLAWAVGLEVDPQVVFAPHLDLPALQGAAAAWEPGDPERPRVFFYARPRHPRNLFRIGIEGVQRFAVLAEAEGLRPDVVTAGDLHRDVALTPTTVARSAGKLSMADYYGLVGRTDLALCLMQSPHPSHMPLELACSGVPTVTNSLGGFRGDWHDRLVRAEADPDALGAALLEAWRTRPEGHAFAPPRGLGGELDAAVAAVAQRVPR